MELLHILEREYAKTPQAYLYKEACRWYAYEHSARQLTRLLASHCTGIEPIINHTYNVIVDRLEVDVFVVLQMLPIRSRSALEVVVDCRGM
jgi:hypothetical protein